MQTYPRYVLLLHLLADLLYCFDADLRVVREEHVHLVWKKIIFIILFLFFNLMSAE